MIAKILLGLLMVLVACEPPRELANHRIIHRACDYLWSQQESDGAWRSSTHRVMSAGHALTPFILWILNQVPDHYYKKEEIKVKSALDFIRGVIDQRGRMGFPEHGILEYPNYANAYALMVLYEYGESKKDSLRIRQLQDYLLGQQFTESRGISREHPAYGGWGFGEDQLPFGMVGQVDLSHTRRVIQALAISEYPMENVRPPVSQFLNRLQSNTHASNLAVPVAVAQPDGGFYYSSVVLGANKARLDEGGISSYPTATCDGYLSLRMAGIEAGQTRALAWLESYPSWLNWGHGSDSEWAAAMQYYHLMVRSEIHRINPDTAVFVSQAIHWLREKQRNNGSFQNPEGAISKEDDPLLTTAMALFTLVNCHLDDN